MALLDNISPMVARVMITFLLLCLFGLSIAMCVAPPQSDIFGFYDYTNTDIDKGDMAWMLTSSALVLIMTPGVAFFYGGMISSRNVVATIATAVLPMCIIPLLWSFIGFSLAFGDDAGGARIIGTPATYGLMYRVGSQVWPGTTMSTSVWYVFQCMFAIITPAILIGAISDRVNFAAMTIFIPLWHLIVYCPVTHMVWTGNGLIASWGLLDFAGGMVVHMSSGYGALAAAKFVGPSKVKVDEPANVPFVVLGTALLWFGWFGFNAGSAFGATVYAGHAFVNTNVATAAAMLTWMLMDQLKGHKFRATGLCLGIVVGLVSVTPAAGYVNVGAAAIIGILGAVCSSLVQMIMDKVSHHADDTLDVFACHGIGGTVGMILTSCFQSEEAGAGINGAFYGNGEELGKCIAVLLALVAWYLLSTYALMAFTNLFISVRVTEEEEIVGLDVSKHDETVKTQVRITTV